MLLSIFSLQYIFLFNSGKSRRQHWHWRWGQRWWQQTSGQIFHGELLQTQGSFTYRLLCVCTHTQLNNVSSHKNILHIHSEKYICLLHTSIIHTERMININNKMCIRLSGSYIQLCQKFRVYFLITTGWLYVMCYVLTSLTLHHLNSTCSL